VERYYNCRNPASGSVVLLKDNTSSTACEASRVYILMQIATEMCANPSSSLFLYDVQRKECTWVVVRSSDHGHTSLTQQVHPEVLKEARGKFMVRFNFFITSSSTYNHL